MSEMEIRQDGLRQAHTDLQAHTDRLNTAWGDLLNTVQGMGEPWGNDDIGSLIGMSYAAVESVADEAFGSAIEALGSFGTGISMMADTHRDTEEDTTQAVSQVGE